ncbi:beta-ketoacyl-[acyl-carrier-protein] synthase family protein [Gammaproteobacteria bacterium]|nr:beta-ketoacyl-[acyl-carrier-protein] synthase family protein [Gammaproteobacteria bacterium]
MEDGIVVTGRGVVSAIGIGVKANTQALMEEKSGIKSLSHFHSNHAVPVGEIALSNVALLEYLHLPKDQRISRTALLGLCAAKEALNEAKLENVDSSRIGIISSTSVGGMDLSEQFYQQYRVDSQTGNIEDIRMHACEYSTQFIAQKCAITGYQSTISTACSSSANAIMLGARLLKLNQLDAVVVGGTDALCKFTLNGFASLKILDDTLCKPFDASREGLNLGEGAGYVVLQRKANVKAYYCELLGWANANDATHQTATSEEGEGAFLSMQRAMQKANLQASSISYINAHGTGTPNNDSSEYRAIERVFETIPLYSSTKSFTGHTLAAAGGIEAVFACIALEEQMVFANLNFKMGNPQLHVNPVLQTRKARVETVLSNSFGFGGNCSTLIFKK